jgi:hypothetical protein
MIDGLAVASQTAGTPGGGCLLTCLRRQCQDSVAVTAPRPASPASPAAGAAPSPHKIPEGQAHPHLLPPQAAPLLPFLQHHLALLLGQVSVPHGQLPQPLLPPLHCLPPVQRPVLQPLAQWRRHQSQLWQPAPVGTPRPLCCQRRHCQLLILPPRPPRQCREHPQWAAPAVPC